MHARAAGARPLGSVARPGHGRAGRAPDGDPSAAAGVTATEGRRSRSTATPRREPRPAVAANREGIAHIAFEVDDVAAATRLVLERGGSRVGDVTSAEVPGVGILTFVYVADPEGNIVELQAWALSARRSAARLVALVAALLALALPAVGCGPVSDAGGADLPTPPARRARPGMRRWPGPSTTAPPASRSRAPARSSACSPTTRRAAGTSASSSGWRPGRRCSWRTTSTSPRGSPICAWGTWSRFRGVYEWSRAGRDGPLDASRPVGRSRRRVAAARRAGVPVRRRGRRAGPR